MNPKRKPPTLNASDLRLIRGLLLNVEKELKVMNRKLARLEKPKVIKVVSVGP